MRLGGRVWSLVGGRQDESAIVARNLCFNVGKAGMNVLFWLCKGDGKSC